MEVTRHKDSDSKEAKDEEIYRQLCQTSLKVHISRNMWFLLKFDLIRYVPSTIFQLSRDGSS